MIMYDEFETAHNSNASIRKLDRSIRQRQHYDPLAVAWLACVDIQKPHITHAHELFREMSSNDVYDIMTGCLVYTVDVEKYGYKLGLWNAACRLTNNWINNAATFAFICVRTITCRDVARIIARMVAKMYIYDIKWLASLCPSQGRMYDIDEDIPFDTPIEEAEIMIRQRIMKWHPN